MSTTQRWVRRALQHWSAVVHEYCVPYRGPDRDHPAADPQRPPPPTSTAGAAGRLTLH